MNAIPVHVLTGFLGAGKTTLLNRAIAGSDFSNTAVIVNEFGDIGIDNLLVEQAGDGIMELSGGCLCCSVRGELAETLERVAKRAQDGRIERVVIETTGLADPLPVLETIGVTGGGKYFAGAVILAVDAANGLETLENHEESVRQVVLADVIIVTKTDLVQDIAKLQSTLLELNDHAKILIANDPGFEPAQLFSEAFVSKTGKLHRGRKHEHDTGHVHDHAGHSHAKAVSIIHEAPIAREAAEMFCDLLLSTLGMKILRLKGLVETAEDPDHPVLLQAAGRILHPAETLAKWPDEMRGTRLVVIGKDIDEEHVRRLFAAFAGKVASDTPDRSALTDNPLAIPGVKF
jgi:G3E family GTPase